MRISDWSSDVCSSDLVEEAVIVADGRRFDAAEQHRRVNFDSRIAGSLLTDNALEPVVLDQVLRQHRGGGVARTAATGEPGMFAAGQTLLEIKQVGGGFEIGRANVCTPVTNAQPECRLMQET